jgi:cytochrome oxidase Cu insertion factor (SCO1/SenC/PrrC family)
MDRCRSARKGIIVKIDHQPTWLAKALIVGLFAFVVSAPALETFRALPSGNQLPGPAFTLPDHHGTPMDSADLQGKVVVVRFWATW